MDTREPVSVYTVSDPTRAGLVRNMLLENGIRCFLDGDNQAAFTGVPALEINILVDAEHAESARKLIEEHEAQAEDEPAT